MIDELNGALNEYQAKWQVLVAERADKTFFKNLRPTGVAWKTTDLTDFDARFIELRDLCDHVHLARINDRWIATMHLAETKLAWDIQVVKLMQRRPGSSDAVGLDHVDFYSPAVVQADSILGQEPNLKWTHETNDHCAWISLWYDGTEAKLRSDTVLDVCIVELQEVRQKILAK